MNKSQTNSNNVGSLRVPNVTTTINNYEGTREDYYYTTNAVGNMGNTISIDIHRNVYRQIRKTISEILKNGYADNVNGITMCRNMHLVAINVNNPGFGEMKLEDATIFVKKKNSKERFKFSLSDMIRVKGISDSSTGTRTNNARKAYTKRREKNN